MKTFNLLGVLLLSCFTLTVIHAQTAEEIVDNYIENIGGHKAWSKVESMKITGIGRQQGVDYPFVATYMSDGRFIIDVNLQGASFIFQAFDGNEVWGMNFQTQKAEAADSETSSNFKDASKDEMVSPFLNYKEKGYKVEFVGKEIWESTEIFKIRLTKKPLMVDGQQEENVSLYYFDTENFVPLASETFIKSGPAKGATEQTVFSDYQEVGGLYVPFSQIDKYNGQIGIELIFEKVEFNSDIDETIFEIPKD